MPFPNFNFIDICHCDISTQSQSLQFTLSLASKILIMLLNTGLQTLISALILASRLPSCDARPSSNFGPTYHPSSHHNTSLGFGQEVSERSENGLMDRAATGYRNAAYFVNVSFYHLTFLDYLHSEECFNLWKNILGQW